MGEPMRIASDVRTHSLFPYMQAAASSNGVVVYVPGGDAAVGHLSWIDRDGALLRHRFERGLMRSAARLTYSQVQEARDGQSDEATGPLLSPVIEPLYGAYAALAAARDDRQALDIELPERPVVVAEDGIAYLKVDRKHLDREALRAFSATRA